MYPAGTACSSNNTGRYRGSNHCTYRNDTGHNHGANNGADYYAHNSSHRAGHAKDHPGTQTTKTIIYMRNNTFVPLELTVLPGTGITWVNDDSTLHSVKTIGNHAGMFNSGEISPGGRWGYTFGANDGVFEFTDIYYPEMKGTIVVQKGESVVGAPTMQTPSP